MKFLIQLRFAFKLFQFPLLGAILMPAIMIRNTIDIYAIATTEKRNTFYVRGVINQFKDNF